MLTEDVACFSPLVFPELRYVVTAVVKCLGCCFYLFFGMGMMLASFHMCGMMLGVNSNCV